MTAAAIGAGVSLAVMLYLSIRYARTVARFLLSLAAARDSFRETWNSSHKSGRSSHAGPVAVPARAPLDVVQTETIEALAGLGMNRGTAAARVRAHGTAADVQTLLKRCMVKAA